MIRKEFKKTNRKIAASAVILLTTVSMATSVFASTLTDTGYEVKSVVTEIYEANFTEKIEKIQSEEPQIYAEQTPKAFTEDVAEDKTEETVWSVLTAFRHGMHAFLRR